MVEEEMTLINVVAMIVTLLMLLITTSGCAGLPTKTEAERRADWVNLMYETNTRREFLEGMK